MQTTKKPPPKKPSPVVRDIGRLNMQYRPRPKPSEWSDLVPDTTEAEKDAS